MIHDGGRDFIPRTWASTLTVEPAEKRTLAFAMENVDSELLFDRVVGGESTAGDVEIATADDGSAEFHVFPSVVLDLADEDYPISSWSLSIAIDGDATCAGVTSEGTAARLYNPAPAFELAECIDPGENGGRRGLVSFSTCCFHLDRSSLLPPRGTFSLLDVTLRVPGTPSPESRLVEIRFEDGLRGTGNPTRNVLVGSGSPVRPWFEDSSLDVRFRRRPFVRGDANFDARLDVSDAVTVLRHQFSGDAEIICHDAADANDDGAVNISDAIAIFGYLFLGRAAPPPPSPEPGVDPTPDTVSCAPPFESR